MRIPALQRPRHDLLVLHIFERDIGIVDPLAVELGKETVVADPALEKQCAITAADQLVSAVLKYRWINIVVSTDEGGYRPAPEVTVIFDPKLCGIAGRAASSVNES